MKWKTKPVPRLGDTRKLVKFAWFPIVLDDGHTVWLEKYRVTERYQNVIVRTKFYMPIYRDRWDTIKKELYIPTYGVINYG